MKVTLALWALLLAAPPAAAEESGARVGGHLGLALPLVTFGSQVSVLGRDQGTVGLTPGVTFKLDPRWALDFEFIALADVKGGSATTFVVDPGVLYDFGPLTGGLRVATQVGAPLNLGVVPIVVLPVKLSARFAWFFELDVPFFLRASGASATLQLQTGLAF
jgi:hypothetical protein